MKIYSRILIKSFFSKDIVKNANIDFHQSKKYKNKDYFKKTKRLCIFVYLFLFDLEL